MRRPIVMTLGLILIATASPRAGTFDKARIAPDQGLDALTRSVAQQQVGRDLFADPWSTVTIGHVDVYDVFPYVESRTFQLVSDPQWNRIVYGEPGQTLKAYDGQGQTLGALKEPRGMAVDEDDRVYVADAGNNRILVLQASTQYGEIQLAPLYAIEGLSHPYDVAWSDGGTPFVSGDDVLYVADTGRNRVVAFALSSGSARMIGAIGDLGSGVGRFAGPMAIAAGRANGVNTSDVYVADSHSQRLVRLRLQHGQLVWLGDVKDGADVVTSLDTDRWGNVYAAAPNRGAVRKFSPDLEAVAELRGDLTRPRSFHLPYFTVRDHRTGQVTREGRANGVSIEQWTDASGVRLWSLGVDVPDLSVSSGDAPSAQFTLTDQAHVTLEVADAASGRTLASQDAGTMPAGVHTMALGNDALRAASGGADVLLRVRAASSYAQGATAVAQTAFRYAGGAIALPSQAMLLGSSPNPVSDMARIAFVLPAAGEDATLRIFDSQGRLVRRFGPSFSAGRNEVVWDGRDESGRRSAPGVYFYKLHTNGRDLMQRMVVVH